MEKENILKAALFAVFLFLHPMGLSSQDDDRDHDDNIPLCKTQIMIVNQACKRLHYNPGPQPNPPQPDPPQPDPPQPDPPQPDPPSPEEPNPNPPDGPDDGRRAGHHGHRRRRQRDDNGDNGDNGEGDDGDDNDDDDEQECCHWLQEIDNECVCAVLLALPSFLSKPTHEYTVSVDGRCRVTYRCNGLHDD